MGEGTQERLQDLRNSKWSHTKKGHISLDLILPPPVAYISQIYYETKDHGFKKLLAPHKTHSNSGTQVNTMTITNITITGLRL